MKKILIGTSVVVVAAVVFLSLRGTPEKMSAEKKGSSETPTQLSDTSENNLKAGEPVAQAKAAPRRMIEIPDGQAPRSAENAPASNNDLVVSELNSLPIDPAKEKFIQKSNLSPNSKRIMLSEMALLNNAKGMSMDKRAGLTYQLQTEVRRSQSELTEGLRGMLANPGDLPAGMSADLVAVANQLTPTHLPEINSIAAAQLTESAAHLSGGASTQPVMDAMVAMALTSGNNTAAAWAKIESTLDMNDIGQANLVRTAKHIVDQKTRRP